MIIMKNGKLCKKNGKLQNCDECPKGSCSLVMFIGGTDYNRDDVEKVTAHTFKINTGDVKIKDFSFSAYSTIDKESKISKTDNGFVVTFDNRGSDTEEDTYDFSISMVVSANKFNQRFGVSHSFSGSAESSKYDVTYSGDCIDDEDDDFE